MSIKWDDGPPLAAGQVWRTKAAMIEIIRLGRRLIHYKITKHLGVKRASTQVSPIQAMQNYLRSNQARLELKEAACVFIA